MELNGNNWCNVVERSNKPVVMDFYAPWCGPCKALGPIIDELANEYGDTVLIGKVNVDECGDVAARYGVMSLPTVLIFKGGQPVERVVGSVTKRELKTKIDAVLRHGC